MEYKNKKNLVFLIIAGSFAWSFQARANENVFANPFPCGQINRTCITKSTPVEIIINEVQSRSFSWKAGQVIGITAYVQNKDKNRIWLKDFQGKSRWEVRLDSNLRGRIQITPDRNSFSGALVVMTDDRIFYQGSSSANGADSAGLEKICERTLRDGVTIRVIYTDQLLEQSGESETFAGEVLGAAALAYRVVSIRCGFNSEGYAYAKPDQAFAYDPNRTIDVYLGHPRSSHSFGWRGLTSEHFKEAPYFDTVKIGPNSFFPLIFLPVNYREFIAQWQQLNPSSLGRRDIHKDLRGTLIHEMFHVLMFYYNKNLNDTDSQKGGLRHQDWYVEGMARYLETMVGARHDFYSQGFRQVLPDKIRFSRGGANYFMRYPDQPFLSLRYENALFWRYMDQTCGLLVFERLSRYLRGSRDERDYQRAIEKATGLPMCEVLKSFARKVLLKDFSLKENSKLEAVARTRLLYKNQHLYLRDGRGGLHKLGDVCRTDWIGSWSDQKVNFGQDPVAGDGTDEADVNGWATDYVEMDIDSHSSQTVKIGICHKEGGTYLAVQLAVKTQSGAIIFLDSINLCSGNSGEFRLNELLAKKGYEINKPEKLYLLLTNLDPKQTSRYEIRIG